MSQPEARISKRIIDACTAKKWYAFKVHGSQYQPAGLPDVLVCAEGYYIGVETKTPDKRSNLSAIQKLRHEQINNAGGYAFVACSAKEAIRKIEEYLASLTDRIDGR